MKSLSDTGHKNRIRKELIDVGVTNYGLLKGESRHLPDTIHKDEHIKGVVYGRHQNGSVMFVATDKRMIFMDHKALFRLNDELSYDVLSGVSINVQGSFAGVVVHTRVGDYSLRFVNIKCAKIFAKYLEAKRIETGSSSYPNINNQQAQSNKPSSSTDKLPDAKLISVDARNFLLSQDMATISSIDRQGNIRGSAVHYVLGQDSVFYMATKSGTQKAQNILTNPQVSLTIFDRSTMQTAQIQGIAEIESNPQEIKTIADRIIKPHAYGKEVSWPPLTKLAGGSYIVIKIYPTQVEFYDYR